MCAAGAAPSLSPVKREQRHWQGPRGARLERAAQRRRRASLAKAAASRACASAASGTAPLPARATRPGAGSVLPSVTTRTTTAMTTCTEARLAAGPRTATRTARVCYFVNYREGQRRAGFTSIGSDRARPINYRRPRRAITDKGEVAQRAKGRKLSNKNICLPTNTSTFEAAIHSIRMTRL